MHAHRKLKRYNEPNWDEKTYWEKYKWVFFFTFLEAIIILLYGLFVEYSIEVAPQEAVTVATLAKDTVLNYYPLFQDIHVMMFIGFGFLMTYLKSHSWTSVGINFLLGAWVIQISILLNGFWTAVITNDFTEKIQLDITWLINADFAAATVLISFGGVLGKMNMSQYLVMATIEIVFYSLNLAIGEDHLLAVDMGGSMFIHTFGAYFGLAVTWVMYRNDPRCKNNENNSSSHNSNLLAMIGCIFLWMYWPSFNGGLASGNARYRIIINTVLSLTGSCIMVFILNPLLRRGKLFMEDVLNATLAGGVIIGAASDLVANAWASILIGGGAGTISLLGFEYVSPFLVDKLHLYDTAGIHNLHGMPGVLGGILGAITVGTVSESTFGESVSLYFPAINNRTPNSQACYQLAVLAITLGISISSGLLTGLLLKCLDGPSVFFTDRVFWTLEETKLEDGYLDEAAHLEEENAYNREHGIRQHEVLMTENYMLTTNTDRPKPFIKREPEDPDKVIKETEEPGDNRVMDGPVEHNEVQIELKTNNK